jgi:Plasmid replication region DNA-binding N-term
MEVIRYDHVPTIVDELLDQGLKPSAKRVRQRLGNRGSYEAIQAQITAHLRATGRLVEEVEIVEEDQPIATPAPVVEYTPPAPDPVQVATRLAELRHASFVARAVALAKIPLQHLEEARRRRLSPGKTAADEAEELSRVMVEGLAAQAGLDPARYVNPIAKGVDHG